MDSINEYDLPLGVEIRHLAALDAIARTRSFSQAAVLLGYAQSAVSQQIATLERVVGHQLVERPGGPRPVSLTAAGEILLAHATHITARLGAAKADLDALAKGELGQLRVGTFQSASARLLPPTLARFQRALPNVTVELRNEALGVHLNDFVQSGQLDLAFADLSGLAAPLQGVELIGDEFVLITPPDHPLAVRQLVELRELDRVDFIADSREDTCTVRITGAMVRAGARPNVVFSSDDNLTTQRLVAAGVGVSIVPQLAIEPDVLDAKVVSVALQSPVLRRIGIVWHAERRRSAAAQAFVETARVVAGEMTAQFPEWRLAPRLDQPA